MILGDLWRQRETYNMKLNIKTGFYSHAHASASSSSFLSLVLTRKKNNDLKGFTHGMRLMKAHLRYNFEWHIFGSWKLIDIPALMRNEKERKEILTDRFIKISLTANREFYYVLKKKFHLPLAKERRRRWKKKW